MVGGSVGQYQRLFSIRFSWLVLNKKNSVQLRKGQQKYQSYIGPGHFNIMLYMNIAYVNVSLVYI